MKSIPNGSTDVTTYFVMRDSTNHAPKADVTVTDIDVYYQEQGAAQSAKADLTALAAADSAHADNKGYHCGNSVYRIDWPDAAFDGGIGKTVILIVVCSGCDTIYREVQLSPQVDVHSISSDATAADNLESACDNYSATRGLAGTALPAAAADAAGGLPISDAGGLDIDAKLANTNEVTAARMGALTDLIDGGRLDLLVDAIKAKTDNLPASPAATGAQMDLVNAPNATALTALAVAILDTLLSEGDADALNARTVRSALRALRNKSSIAAGVLTVCKENDSDSAWTGAVTTDGAAEPITVIDPT